MTIAFAATEDVLTPGQRLVLKPAARALYMRRGRVVIAQYGTETILTEDDCALIVGAATLTGDGVVWGCETTRDLAAPDPLRTILHVRLPRDPNAPMVLRADRVDFPPDAVTPRHGHAGPGIRRLLAGRLFAEIGETHRRIDAGEAWFESGLEPVVGHNIAPASAFVRCLVLDPDLLGRPTFRAASPEDAAKPRAVGYRQFFDTIVTLPH
jgi:quercetin dioxygenase-like cupin family protein